MANDIFLLIDSIAGESQDATYPQAIELTSWNWRIEQSASMMSGSGGGAGKSTVHDINVVHNIDRASPNLAAYCAKGTHIAEARLIMRKAGGIPHEYYRITLYDVVITGVSPAVSASMAVESVSLSFARKKMEYVVQDQSGRQKGTVTALIDVRYNFVG